ncbi:general stress protein [Brachybacterium muris]|uniref:General stress protein 17M-like domain-containing protein n=1 Tax=Brachybacterium muris UCD-AY4 TaxID=1249481 RepID=A0A022L4Z3_9MICO|nr:general stress protein [Brachybacterium muris]EYT51018.1 hypothetical protein D641_0100675 [Brachybacterium muris UCD-AY4]
MTQMQNQTPQDGAQPLDREPVQDAQSTNATPGGAAFTAAPSMTKVADFSDYTQAQAAVDLLSDSGFEVGSTRIVGHDLKSVEIVRGRMNYGKAALFGAGSGAWFGLLIGLLMAIFVPIGFLSTVLGAVVFGAIWGAIFGLIAFAAQGQNRNFHSQSTMKASSYTVEVPFDRAQSALEILNKGR